MAPGQGGTGAGYSQLRRDNNNNSNNNNNNNAGAAVGPADPAGRVLVLHGEGGGGGTTYSRLSRPADGADSEASMELHAFAANPQFEFFTQMSNDVGASSAYEVPACAMPQAQAQPQQRGGASEATSVPTARTPYEDADPVLEFVSADGTVDTDGDAGQSTQPAAAPSSAYEFVSADGTVHPDGDAGQSTQPAAAPSSAYEFVSADGTVQPDGDAGQNTQPTGDATNVAAAPATTGSPMDSSMDSSRTATAGDAGAEDGYLACVSVDADEHDPNKSADVAESKV